MHYQLGVNRVRDGFALMQMELWVVRMVGRLLERLFVMIQGSGYLDLLISCCSVLVTKVWAAHDTLVYA
ncbi:hypothetical protein GQ457_11G004410 [Hibiscus cannabinus]